MIHTSDGTTFKRVGGKPGDRSPAVGFKRDVATYQATGGESSIDLATLSPPITYQPGLEQIRVMRSSMPGDLWAGRDFQESSPTSIAFLNGSLLAGEEVKIIKEFSITGVQAATIRPDAHSETASAGQTLISASFSWDYNLNPSVGIGAVAVFLNGVLQRRGVDYNEVSLGSGFTNQIQFIDPLIGGENILMIPTYVQVDNMAGVAAYQNSQLDAVQKLLTAGMQSFVDDTTLISAPATSISNRAKIPDLANRLMARYGVNRVHTQQLVQVFGEAGLNGEIVWTCPGDISSQIRFVGNGWQNGDFLYGDYVRASNVGEWLEFTFYGTGLNLLGLFDSGSDFRVAVDSDSYGGNILPSGKSNIINARSYSAYEIIPVVKDLSLGIHTVKIKRFNSSGFYLNVHGFEILNQSTSIGVDPGNAYVLGKKYSPIPIQSTTFKTSFENILDAAVGTRGGHAVIYLKSDNTIAKAFTPTDSTQKNLTAADHSNEEVIRKFNYREFGSGRSDDFSTINTLVSSNRAYTLDDNTTTMLGQGVLGGSTGGIGVNAANDFLVLTFVGTGLDIVQEETPASFTGTHQVLIDGNVIFSGNLGTVINKGVWKIVSGLPYGTHTFKFIKTAGGSGISFHNVLIYGPKKPTVPSSAIELADYYVLADFDASNTNGTAVTDNVKFPTGVISKFETRELIYTGSSWSASLFPTTASGWDLSSPTTGDSVYYTFFGTGFQFHGYASGGGGTYDVTVTIDGVANASGTVRGNATALGGGVYRSTSTTYPQPYRIDFTGLSLGVHTVRVQKTAGIGNFNPGAFHIITPIHSPKYQNPLYQTGQLIGNCSLGDSRKFSPIKDTKPIRVRSQAFGATSNPTNSSSTYVPLPDMMVGIYAKEGDLDIDFRGLFADNNNNINTWIAIYVDGFPTIQEAAGTSAVASAEVPINISFSVPVSEGFHVVQAFWRTNVGTSTALRTDRILRVKQD